MRLLRLLAAGKSLIGVKPTTGRYRTAPAKALPVFESVANPFRATAVPQSGTAASNVNNASDPHDPQPTVGTVAASDESSPVQDHVRSPSAPVAAVASEENKSETRNTAGRSRWFRWRPFGKPADTSAIPSVPRAIQGELSLDNIRPVRNDLGDSDFEVVAVARTTSHPKEKKNVSRAASSRELDCGKPVASETAPGFSKINTGDLSANPK